MTEPPPSPRAILRGHKAQVHSVAFIRHNERLATGDADGFVVLWDLSTMRPRAVWQAHSNAILSMLGWGDRIITHGRDHKLIVWKASPEDEARLGTALPLEDAPSRPQPWMLHLLEVNTMNFCSFSVCVADSNSAGGNFADASEILIAVPNTLASEAVDIYTLPSQSRVETVKPGQGNGMVMSLALFHHAGALTLAAGFENGSASVHLRQADGTWTMTYRSQVHTQPVLSLAVDASHQYFLTSAADAIIAKNPIPTKQQEILPPISAEEQVVEVRDDGSDSVFGASLLSSDLRESSSTPQTRRTARKPWEHPLKVVNTKHSGQQGLQIRSDGRIFVTAGWDSNLRVFSCKTLQELAVLGWHKAGCYAAAFADICTEWVPESLSSTSDAGAHPSSRQLSSSATMMSVQDRRILQAKTAHWVAAGAKDGKVSLWEIY